MLAYAERLLRLSSEAEAAIRTSTPRGTLRLGTLESTAAPRLPPVLARYHASYPGVMIEIVTGTSGALRRMRWRLIHCRSGRRSQQRIWSGATAIIPLRWMRCARRWDG
jgi:DNA-binding transcriptional LysR family regulator